MQTLRSKINNLIKTLPVKQIKTEPCFNCYTCCEINVEECGSILSGYRLQWFEKFDNISTEEEGEDISCYSYPENDFYLDFNTKKDLSKIINYLHESEKKNIEYVLENSNRFEFELIFYK